MYLKPCMYLKSENVNTENEGAVGKNVLHFWNLSFQNEKMDGEWTDLPLQNITPLLGQPISWNQKYLTSRQKNKIPTPPS